MTLDPARNTPAPQGGGMLSRTLAYASDGRNSDSILILALPQEGEGW
ncbi:hypothetical protein ACWGJW_10545 [Streptomyces nigrescens]